MKVHLLLLSFRDCDIRALLAELDDEDIAKLGYTLELSLALKSWDTFERPASYSDDEP